MPKWRRDKPVVVLLEGRTFLVRFDGDAWHDIRERKNAAGRAYHSTLLHFNEKLPKATWSIYNRVIRLACEARVRERGGPRAWPTNGTESTKVTE